MGSKQYRRKICLYFLWQSRYCRKCDYDPNCHENCDSKIFSETINKGYGFDVLICRMPNLAPGLSMRKFIKWFIEIFSHQDTLLLVYYHGHGGYHERLGLYWGLGDMEGPEVHPVHRGFFCRPILRQLVSASSDVLIVLDCCQSVPRSKEMCLSTPLPRQGGRTEIIGACTTAQLSSTQFNFHLLRILQARYKSGRETLWRRLPKYVERERKEICHSDWERRIRETTGPSNFPVSSYLKLHSEKGTITLTPMPRGVKRMQLELKNKVKDKLWNLTDGIYNRIVHPGSW